MRRFTWMAVLLILGAALEASGARAATLYVTNQGENTISVIDTATRKVVKTVIHVKRRIFISPSSSTFRTNSGRATTSGRWTF